MLPRKFFDKIGAIRCILSVPKLVIINLKINIFLENKSTTQKLWYIFLQDPSRCALWHKNKYIHILEGGSGGAIAPRSQRNVKKEALRFHTRRKDISCNDVYSDSC